MPSILRDREAVEAAAREATSYADLCIRLGLSRRGANIARAKAACRDIGILDLPKAEHPSTVTTLPDLVPVDRPRRGVFADRDRVVEAADRALTYMEILTRLGVAVTAKNYRRLELVATEYGIELPRLRPNGPNQKRGPLPRPRPRRSAAWNEDALRRAVDGAKSTAEVLRRLGLSDGSVGSLRSAAAHYGIRLPMSNAGRRYTSRAVILEQLVQNGQVVNGQRLRKWLVRTDLLKDECAECGAPPVWNGRPLVLQLDHINGIPTDNRLANLRLLCPNCHSQTETFAGKKLKGFRWGMV